MKYGYARVSSKAQDYLAACLRDNLSSDNESPPFLPRVPAATKPKWMLASADLTFSFVCQALFELPQCSVENLTRVLDRARGRRDALASQVTTPGRDRVRGLERRLTV
jgi:hypothetical protein